MWRERQVLPLPHSARALRGCWKVWVPVRLRVLKQRVQQGVKQQVKLLLEPMGHQQVGIFF